MKEQKDDTENAATDEIETETTEAKISNFAAKLGEETGNDYQVYIYRMVRDEESGRQSKPFIKKYIGVEPDPAEIAEKFRGGKYLVQFIWYVKKVQKSKAYTVEIDAEAFPPLPKQSNMITALSGNSNLSEAMQMQLATMATVADVMKSAYASGNNGPGRNVVQSDPLEMFSGLMETMESTFTRSMAIQQQIMERVFQRNMEKNYGLLTDETAPAPVESGELDQGLIARYAPIVREIVDGIKTVMSLFGEMPKKVIDKVKSNDRFQALLRDPKALTVVGSALRKEFGDDKAASIMNSFGVRMVFKQSQQVHKTPDIPGTGAAGGPGISGTVAHGDQSASAQKPGTAAPVSGKKQKKQVR